MNTIKKAFVALLGTCGLAASTQAMTFQTVTADISTDTRWNNDTVYVLTRIIFVQTGATLTVEPGTIVRGIDNVQAGDGVTPGNRPGGLVVGPGAKIVANGTPDRPIIFTSIDDPWVPGGGSTIPASFVNAVGRTLSLGTHYGNGTATGFGGAVLNYTGAPYSINRRWSGLILAGRAYVGQNSAIGAMMTNPLSAVGTISTNVADANMDKIPDAGFSIIKADPSAITVPNPANKPKERSLGGDYIEGLEPINTSDREYLYGFYGGTDDSDDSGCVRWVSIRYSGFDLEAAKELQGLTPAAIGTGTQLEWVESILSSDDGAEFFGGKNDTRYLFSHYNDDDSFDGDEGHRGVHQFWSVVQSNGASPLGTGNADEVIEFDGSEEQFVTTGQSAIPESNIAIYNFTVLTNPENDGGQIDGDEGVNLTIRGAVVDGDDGAFAGVFDFDNDAVSGGILTYEDVFYNNSIGIGDTSPVAAGSTATAVAPGSLITSNNPYTAGGVDTRLKSTSAAYNNAVAATPAGLSYAPYAACQRQNTLTRGWTLLSAAGDNAAAGVSRVVAEGAVNNSMATKPAIVFDAPAGSNADTIYHVYRSSNGCAWIPAGTIKDGSIAAVGGFSADADGSANKLKFNDDNGPVLVAGVPVFYYVVAN